MFFCIRNICSAKINVYNLPLRSKLINNKFSKIYLEKQNICYYGTDVTVTIEPLQIEQYAKEKISKAMRAYLERSRAHDEFMKIKNLEYQIGKRHLANMMGEDPENFTQADVDRAIEYLFPSGLYDKKAKPMMKLPEEIFPQRKAAEFDESGRPHHSMFYTGLPHFFKLMFDIVENMNELMKYEDRMIRKQVTPDDALTINLSGSQWLSKEELERYLVEVITDIEYSNFVNAMNRLVALPYSYKRKEFIDKFRKLLLIQRTTYEIPKPLYNEEGRMYVTTYECLRKRARGDVTVIVPGTGQIKINDQDITYFEDKQPREQCIRKPMENLGYKEGPAKPKYRRVARPTKLDLNNVNEEEYPLTLSPQIKIVPAKWRQNNNSNNTKDSTVIEEQYDKDDFEFVECGPSPPAEILPSKYDTFEEPNTELSVQICSETIRKNLLEQMKLSSGRVKLLDDIEHLHVVKHDNVMHLFEGATKIEKNISFLWAAFLKRSDIFEGLIESGADLTYYDQNGLSALHLAAFSGCLKCVRWLLSRGVDANLQPKYYTPLHCAAFGNSPETAKLLISSGADIQINTSKKNCEESLLHCAVRANAVECLQLLVTEGADVNSLKPNGTNAIHLAADLGLPESLKILLDKPNADPNIRICISEKEATALHLAADEGNEKCVELLLSHGADAKLKNHRGFTPLHLAARTSSLSCVTALLKYGNANPNAVDLDQRTPLHAAIGKSEYAFDILEMLITWGANINQRDVFGATALHLAALEGLAHCVELLIFHGADVTIKSKKGISALNIISRKTPTSLAMLTQLLNSAITLHEVTDTREIELELDFRQLLQHCHPKEIGYLNKIVDEGQKELVEHPLCQAFLYVKWEKIRKYYIARLAFCFINVLFLSLYVLTALAYTCYNRSSDMNNTILTHEICQQQSVIGDVLRNNPFVIEMQWWVLVFITVFEIFRKIYGINGYSSIKHYVTTIENIFEWYVIVSVFLISYIYNQRIDIWQNHVAAFAVLAGWTNLMFMVGQLPSFGVYVSMYTKVQHEFAKLFMAYSCMLIGFTISFCVVFPQWRRFENPLMGVVSVLVMSCGEQDLHILDSDVDAIDSPVLLEISAQIIFVLFQIFVVIILMNLLLGIAVDDIDAIKKTAELSKLVRQTKLISYIESAFFIKYLPSVLRKFLHRTALVSPQSYRVLLRLKPLNPEEKRLPHDLMMAAFEIGKQNKDVRKTVSIDNTYSPFAKQQLNDLSSTDKSPESGYVFDTASVFIMTKVDANADKIDSLTNEVNALKMVLIQNHQVIDKLLHVISSQHKQTAL